ncbi:MAG: PEP/pyruvate-binding domain-containing protein, partial [bacterium]|nr:PEP/pyruvate-binding domain-containing protein [bacterium]
MELFNQASSGLKGLDEIINGLRKGDNVVWQVDSVSDYRYFVLPFVQNALAHDKKVVYIRFADHEALLEPQKGLTVHKLDAYTGFEPFSHKIHSIIKEEGEDVYYVFDCLSSLLSAWATDLMIGNFFMVTCPYLYELNTVTYFAILRNNHSYKTIARIRETTQLLLDLYNLDRQYYVHPLKVWNRYSPTMYLPHHYISPIFKPVTSSVETSKVFAHIYQKDSEPSQRNLDYWDRLFIQAEEIAECRDQEEKERMISELCRIMIGRENRILVLARDNLMLQDLINIKNRMIGTGYIGGKAAGMLISRNILLKNKELNWSEVLEPHDSFYIGSDVFYTYIVQNGLWKLWMEHKTEEGFYRTAPLLHEKMLHGFFPEEIKEQFLQMIEYFGQSPIIIRSSSLLEDSFGNAFAGKYESIFNVNQGTPEQRYTAFEDSVRRIFASTMNQDALAYRMQRGLRQMDEQMALLVMRVSGAYRKNYFFPDLAGVGISYNIYLWNDKMDPKAGLIRLVFGLGTHAVNRVENDYPRIVALDMPLMKPHSGLEDTRKFSQHEADILNIPGNRLETIPLMDYMDQDKEFKWDMIAVRDTETMARMDELGMKKKEAWIITFDQLLGQTPFTVTMQKLLKIIEGIYQYPVEVEFTVNFTRDGSMKISLLQCRPLQAKQMHEKVRIPGNIAEQKTLFRSHGYFMGGNISQSLKRIIFIEPPAYSGLNQSGKYETARIIGRLNRLAGDRKKMPVMLIGPGRWGTTTPSLGVPVSFSEINNSTVLTEISYVSGNLMPELSFGTHFFQDLVETGLFYVALFTEKQDVFFNRSLFDGFSNQLTG